MKKLIISYILCILVAFTFIGCGGINISFNSDDKSAKGIKEDQNNEDKSNVTDKTAQEENKQDKNADDKSNVTVNITNDDTPKTPEKKDVIIIKEPVQTNTSNVSFVFYNSDCAYLTQSQVSSLSNYQLGIARNEIYARHGYIFSLERFKSYFNSQSWYRPITTNVTLNNIETYNVKLIKAEEDRRGIKWN